jgi:protein SCO1/2
MPGPNPKETLNTPPDVIASAARQSGRAAFSSQQSAISPLRALLLGLVLAGSAAWADFLPVHGQGLHDAAPYDNAYTRTIGHYRPPAVQLVDMQGRAVSLDSELNGDMPVMVNFIFTTCTAVCTVNSATFAKVQETLAKTGKRYRLISISIDPEQDTPARLRDYATRYKAGPDWHFLTGDGNRIKAVQRAFDAYRGGKMNHAPLTYLRARPDGPWVRYEGFVHADELVEDYRRLNMGVKMVQR